MYGTGNQELDKKFLEQLNQNERSWFISEEVAHQHDHAHEQPRDIKKVATATAIILGGYLLYSWLKAR